MSSPLLDNDSFSVDFSQELLAAFDFGGFELTGGSLFSFGSYKNEYNDASFSFSVESYVGVRNRNRRTHKKRRPNRQFRKKSVKRSCWYREFLRPGITRDLTHELSTLDRFVEFRNWFRMPLSKIQQLTDMFINREYIKPARSLSYRAEFRERSELFIMTALYRVGTLKDGYVRNVPLPRIPQRQSASHMTSHELIAPKTGIPISGYLQVPSWIPTLPKLGSILGFS